ncbi:MAG: glycosyltransferase family 39 protein [Chloroflexi bacterium]|nr:glycosyltransferase family 39 protein [Chloroflexota bacterium]
MRDHLFRLPGWRPNLGLVLIVAIYLVLAFFYSVATPIFEASDEIFHYPFVKLLAEGKGLPIQKPRAEDNLARQEGSQPPLYYALGAAATFWIDTGNFSSLVWINPHAQVGVPLVHGNKNMVIHTSEEKFPYRGPALAVHIIRWLNLILGAMTIVSVYSIARHVFPQRPEVALRATAVVAFVPQFAFISASVDNDNLIIALASAVILILVRCVRHGITFQRSLVLGLALGLALLSKLTALGLIPLVAACLALIWYLRRPPARFLQYVGIVSLLPVVIAGWWYVRNWQLYGDPTGLSMMLRIVGVRTPTPSLFDLLSEFQGFRISFWGLFGAVNIIADEWVYQALDGAAILAGLGLALAATSPVVGWIARARGKPKTDTVLRKLRQWHSQPNRPGARLNSIPSGILLLIPVGWLLVNSGLLIRWTQTTLGTQGRLIFPAISGVALLLALGWSALVPRRLSGLALTAIAALLLGFSASAPFRYIVPAYAGPPIVAENEVSADVTTVNIDFDGKMRLIGYRLDRRQLQPGDTVRLTLYWQILARMAKDYSIFIHFRGRGERAVAQEDTYPGLGAYPTRLLRPGDVFSEEHRLSVDRDAEAPSLVQLAVGLYYFPDMVRLPAHDSAMRSLRDDPVLAEVKLADPARGLVPAHPIEEANFGDSIELIGYDIDRTQAAPGDKLDLTLYWRAREKPADDYTVFTQLLGGQQTIVGQSDGQPVGGYYPTHLWDAGEVVADRHVIQVHADAPPGKLTLIAGLYRLATDQRLPLLGSDGKDYLTVSDIEVIPPNYTSETAQQ